MSEEDPVLLASETAEIDSVASALLGLVDGDLAPLAAHIRRGFPVDSILAEELANLIDGLDDPDYRLILKGRTRGQLSYSRQRDFHLQKLRIAFFVQDRQREGIKFAASVADAALHFAVSQSTVEAAVTYFKKFRQNDRAVHRLFDLVEDTAEILDETLGLNDND